LAKRYVAHLDSGRDCKCESIRTLERIIDLHEDISDYLMTQRDASFDDNEAGQATLPKYAKAGVALVVSAIFPLMRSWNPYLSQILSAGYGSPSAAQVPRSTFMVAIEQVKIYYRLFRSFANRLIPVNALSDIETSLKSDRLGLLLSLEGADALEDSSDLEVLYRLGVRALGLTWNYDNRYASSCMSKKDYGLTGEGERLVNQANELGVVIDLAHSGKRTALESLSASTRPVMISHANYQRVHPHMRNVDDEVLEALKKNKGVMGFTMITDTIGPNPSIATLAEHVMTVKRNFGPDILAIGTDYLGIGRTPKGLEDIAKLTNLLDKLRGMGMSEEEIRKVAWENAYGVLTQNAKLWR
jgi:membrane dipeptidase